MNDVRAHALGIVAALGVAFSGACTEKPSPSPQTPPMTSAALAAPTASGAGAAPVAPLPAAPASAPAAVLHATGVALPGASAPASLDYIAVDRTRGRVWVPVGNTGSVDVFDVKERSFTRVDGFATAEREGRSGKRTVGPSAVSLGEGVAYIGNRATSEVCTVDMASLKRGVCVKLGSGTDGVAYAASAKEVWVTTPDAKTVEVLDASPGGALKPKAKVKLDGEPEGYAFDEKRGLFFTNLEDQGGTVVIDVKTHKPTATWNAGCGKEGPRGLAFDAARGFLVVACTDHVQVLDAGHDGARLGSVETGAGVDNLDYLESKRLLYVAAGRDARLDVLALDDKGQLTLVARGETAPGARNAVADASGKAYVADSRAARLLVVGD